MFMCIQILASDTSSYRGDGGEHWFTQGDLDLTDRSIYLQVITAVQCITRYS